MRLVVFADAQGNPWAVEAVLRAARKVAGAEVACLGNAVGAGPDPAGAVERLRKARVLLVRGPRDAAALNLPEAPPALREEGQRNLARLDPADVAYLRESTPPRRLVAQGRSILLTSAPFPEAGQADVVLRPGETTGARRVGPRLDVTLAPLDNESGESPFVVYDPERDEATIHHAIWDADARQAARPRRP